MSGPITRTVVLDFQKGVPAKPVLWGVVKHHFDDNRLIKEIICRAQENKSLVKQNFHGAKLYKYLANKGIDY